MPRAIVLDDPGLPAYDGVLPRALDRTLQEAGYSVTDCTAEALISGATSLEPSQGMLLVLPQARQLPLGLQPVVTAYLKRGGNLLALGAPAWQNPSTAFRNGRWQTAAATASESALTPPQRSFLEFNRTFPLRAMNHKASTQIEIAPTGASAAGEIAGAMHVVIPDFTGGDLISTPLLRATPFAANEMVTTLSARGGPGTAHLSLEWDDRNGSRWIAVIALTDSWQHYQLSPADFRPWQVPDRAVAKAGFQPATASRLRIGLSYNHTGRTSGRQEYWVAGIGTALPQPDESTTEETKSSGSPAGVTPDLTPLETVAPGYKFYEIHGLVRVKTPDGLKADAPVQFDSADSAALQLEAPHPRPGGGGYKRGRGWRWMPLLEARDPTTNDWRGAPATLLVHAPGSPFGGGVWASFAVGDPAFYHQDAVQHLIGEVASKMRDGLYLIDGGAEYYTAFSGQEIHLGATVANVGPAAQPADLRIVVTRRGDSSGKPVWQHTWSVAAGANTTSDTADKEKSAWTPPAPWPVDGYSVATELLVNGKVVDHLQHSLYDWEPSPNPQFVTSEGGHFTRSGARWRACGVNYMPSSGVGQESDDLFQYWFDAAAYDPEVIERDLSRIEGMGLNAVSVFSYTRSASSQNLLDFLRRCRLHHIMVDLQLGGGVSKVDGGGLGLISRLRLAENDALYAYGIAWEPTFGNYAVRARMDPAWAQWIDTKYGSAARAEQQWGYAVPRAQGSVTGPSDIQFMQDGPWHRMVVAYRRFLDDWIADTYGPVVSQMHKLDPHHFVSFRMNYGGSPTNHSGDAIYTFEGQAKSLDILEPEAYNLVGDPKQILPGLFEVAYARAVAPDKPLVWQEVGVNVWDSGAGRNDPVQLDFSGHFYHDFFQMAKQSGSDGLFWWCYPGGARATGGLKDYGIINPDGTDRPSTAVIRSEASAFRNAPSLSIPDVLLPFNRNDYSLGENGVYEALKDRYYGAIDQGHRPALRSTTRD